ncbi:MAG: hypothetical protein DWQ37_22205 [Planctomycetota bacterium]|nr:MAG: hypothetical protein DWQ37_22205 [Planctomycetota bacterium]
MPLLALAVATGCRSNTNQTLVEQEARMFEDEVYRLEAQLDSCCRENKELKRQLADLRGGPPGSGSSSSGSRSSGGYNPPAVEMPLPSRGPRSEAPTLEPPKIELPEASDTPPEVFVPGDEQPAAIPDGASRDVSDEQPTKLVINQRLTGGLDRDREGGDEGIMVMVEPRDDRGELVRAPGAVSVVVMDPQLSGDAARVARWDFQAHEFDDHFRKSAFGQGLQYELSWPNGPPKNRDLMLFVRYLAPDGSKLTSDAPLHLRMASDSPGKTVQREPRSRLKRTDTLSRENSEGDEDRSRARREPRSPRQASNGRPEWSPER